MAVRKADAFKIIDALVGDQRIARKCEVVIEVGGVVEMDHQ